jgi:tetratricopeptide (TPR) repeat protein
MPPGAIQTQRGKEWRTVLVALSLGIAVLACFWPVTRNQFINMDDLDYITQNTHVQAGLTWPTIKWAFTTFHAGNWHPITWLSHALDCQVFGLKAAGHHAVSAVLHAANTMLLFWVLLMLTRPQPSSGGVSSAECQVSGVKGSGSTFWCCALVAGLFGLHPMHVESVAWAAERKDVLSAFFFLLTLWAYGKYVEGKFETRNSKLETNPKSQIPNPASGIPFPVSRFPFPASFFYCLSLAFFSLGLMSKPMLVTTPFILLLLDYWPLRRFGLSTINSQPSTLLLEKLPFAALSIGASVLTMLAQRQSGYVISVETLPFDVRLINAAVSYTAYLKRLFWPVDLALYYPLNTDLPIEYGFAAAFLILLISTAAFAWLRSRPYFLVGWLWFLGTLVPVIGLVQVGLQSMADRYSYIPSIGVFVAVVWLAAERMRPRTTRPRDNRTASSPPEEEREIRGLWSRGPWSVVLLSVVSLSALIACAILTEIQIGYWKSNETLYRHTLKITPDNPLIIGNLGCALVEAGRYKEATDYLEEALKEHPGSAEAQVSWGVALEMQGRRAEGIEHYRRAIELDPRLERPHYLLASALVAQGKRNEAAQEYQIALEINPDSAYAANDFAWILATAPDPALRDGPRAVALAEKACELSKYSDPLLIGTLAAAYAEAGQFEKAVKTATLAEEKAGAMGDKSLARRNAELREIYRKGQAYHEEQNKTDVNHG